ncbi:MAG: tyrosinase family protein [Bacteroidota bacterium]
MSTLFSKPVDRRDFLKKMSQVGVALTFTTFGACERLAEAIRNRPTRYRMRAGGGAAVDQAASIYSDAVRQMKALPSTNPRSWVAQARIHGTPASFNFCRHNTLHFLSWHRAYLFYFEKICQTLTGESKFGLPYWNWSVDPSLPPQFTVSGSPLFEPTRVRTTLSNSNIVSRTRIENILGNSNFAAFSNQLEVTPHNYVHGNISGVLGQGNSPMDPVFWLHHCMIDCIWTDWTVNRGNDNPNNGGWPQETWTHFIDGDGNAASTTAAVTSLMPLLSYQYEDTNHGETEEKLALRTRSDFQKVRRRIEKGTTVNFDIGERLEVSRGMGLDLAQAKSQKVDVRFSQMKKIIDDSDSKDRVFVSVELAKLPPANDFFVRVYVNAPEADRNTGTESIHFAGSFAFFGTSEFKHNHEGGHHHTSRSLVDISSTLRKLMQNDMANDDSTLTLSFVAVPLDPALGQVEAALDIEKIDLIMSGVSFKSNP